jgi:hypothetical protein
MEAIRALTLLTIVCIISEACVTPFLLLYFSVYRVKILKQNWRPVLAKAIVSLVGWSALSFLTLAVIFFSFIYGDRLVDTPPTLREEAEPLMIFCVLIIVYGLVGWGLCRWVKGPPSGGLTEQRVA